MKASTTSTASTTTTSTPWAGKGDVWHYDGQHWRQAPFPTNQWTKAVCCGADGQVYIACYEGLVLAGRGNRWKAIHPGGISLGFADMVWYEDRVWCTNDHGLWTIHNNKLTPAPVDSDIRVCSGSLTVNDGVLLLAENWRCQR